VIDLNYNNINALYRTARRGAVLQLTDITFIAKSMRLVDLIVWLYISIQLFTFFFFFILQSIKYINRNINERRVF
jgi:hypothetical protein